MFICAKDLQYVMPYKTDMKQTYVDITESRSEKLNTLTCVSGIKILHCKKPNQKKLALISVNNSSLYLCHLYALFSSLLTKILVIIETILCS